MLEPGDRVKVKGANFNGSEVGEGALGTVAIIVDDFHVGVVFDQKFKGGHNLEGASPNYPIFEDGHCRWGQESQLEVIGKVEPPIPKSYGKYPGHSPSFVGQQFPTTMRPVKEPKDD